MSIRLFILFAVFITWPDISVWGQTGQDCTASIQQYQMCARQTNTPPTTTVSPEEQTFKRQIDQCFIASGCRAPYGTGPVTPRPPIQAQPVQPASWPRDTGPVGGRPIVQPSQVVQPPVAGLSPQMPTGQVPPGVGPTAGQIASQAAQKSLPLAQSAPQMGTGRKKRQIPPGIGNILGGLGGGAGGGAPAAGQQPGQAGQPAGDPAKCNKQLEPLMNQATSTCLKNTQQITITPAQLAAVDPPPPPPPPAPPVKKPKLGGLPPEVKRFLKICHVAKTVRGCLNYVLVGKKEADKVAAVMAPQAQQAAQQAAAQTTCDAKQKCWAALGPMCQQQMQLLKQAICSCRQKMQAQSSAIMGTLPACKGVPPPTGAPPSCSPETC